MFTRSRAIVISFSLVIIVVSAFAVQNLIFKRSLKDNSLLQSSATLSVQPTSSALYQPPVPIASSIAKQTVYPVQSDAPADLSFRISTYGVELTKNQHQTFISTFPKVEQTDSNVLSAKTQGKWFYWGDIVIQNYEFLRQDSKVCAIQTAWCGTANLKQVEQECKNYSTKENDWSYSNTSACCRSYVHKVDSVISCSTLDQKQEYSSEDYALTLSVLKTGGVDCANSSCGEKVKTNILIPN